MTPSPELLAELRPLVDEVCDETITPDRLARLEALILANPEAEAYCVQYLHFYAELSRHFTALPDPAGVPARGSAASKRRRWSYVGLGVLGLAAGLFLAVQLTGPAQPRRLVNPDAPPAEPTDDSVAVLLRTYKATWEDTGMPTRAGDALPPGRLVLKSGHAQIEFYNGATVLLEGPADFRIVSRTGAYCARGKLRATVPAQAVGFSIGSPTLDLVDRGTEFGLAVVDGASEVHVFQGKVDLYDPAGTGGRPRRAVTTGEALTAAGQAIPADPTAFRSAKNVADQAARDLVLRKEAWAATAKGIRTDPATEAYFPFERAGDDRELSDAARARHGVIVGTAWGTGRWADKSALEFRRVTDRVRIRIPGEFDSLTLAAWVRIDGLPNVNNSLVMADGWEVGEVHWQIGSDGSLILGVRLPSEVPNQRGVSYKALSAVTPDRYGTWTHVAVVYDHGGGTVTHYLNGRPASVATVTAHVPLRFGDGEIGNWNVAGFEGRTPVRNFTGGIDDVLIASRALTPAQVEALYTTGRPPQ